MTEEFLPHIITVRFAELVEALKYFRFEANLTMEQTAKGVGCYFTAISHYENGKRRPSLETIERLANLYGYDVTFSFRKRNDAR